MQDAGGTARLTCPRNCILVHCTPHPPSRVLVRSEPVSTEALAPPRNRSPLAMPQSCGIFCVSLLLELPGVGRALDGTKFDANLAGDRPARRKVRPAAAGRLPAGDRLRGGPGRRRPAVRRRTGPGICTSSIWKGPARACPSICPSVQEILAAVDIECELGGGIRDEQSICELLDFGLSRLVIGTSALDRSGMVSRRRAASIRASWCWGSTPATAGSRPTAGSTRAT